MIYNFNEFILEHSKYDPIPELTWDKKGKTAIFVFGAPGTGKSTFIDKVIIQKLRSYKIFDPDKYIDALLKIGKERKVYSDEERIKKLDATKIAINRLNNIYKIDFNLTDDEIYNIIDNNTYVEGVDKKIEKSIITYSKNSNSDFIYDTTGYDYDRIKNFSEISRDNGYKIIFIQVSSSVESAVRSNVSRDRIVQLDYQLSSIEGGKNQKQFLQLSPDAYYVYERDINSLFKYQGEDLRLEKENLIK